MKFNIQTEKDLQKLTEKEQQDLLAALLWEMAIEDIAKVLCAELPKKSSGRATLIYQLSK